MNENLRMVLVNWPFIIHFARLLVFFSLVMVSRSQGHGVGKPCSTLQHPR